MPISQFRIVTARLGAVMAMCLLVGLSGCVVVPQAGSQVEVQTVNQRYDGPYYPPYWPFFNSSMNAPYYSPWYEPAYPSRYPVYPSRPGSNLPGAQVAPVR